MMRPIFLTRTQRVLATVRNALSLIAVIALFIGLGLLLGHGISS